MFTTKARPLLGAGDVRLQAVWWGCAGAGATGQVPVGGLGGVLELVEEPGDGLGTRVGRVVAGGEGVGIGAQQRYAATVQAGGTLTSAARLAAYGALGQDHDAAAAPVHVTWAGSG